MDSNRPKEWALRLTEWVVRPTELYKTVGMCVWGYVKTETEFCLGKLCAGSEGLDQTDRSGKTGGLTF
jgi:hypothetical protein